MGAVTDAAPIAAALSAVGAWWSAWNSRQAVERSHRPFVYGEPEVRTDEYNRPEHRWVALRLRNDGTGVALDARFRLEAEDGSWAGDATLPVRAMRAGDVVPPEPGAGMTPMLSSPSKTWFEVDAPPSEVQRWAVVVRFADTAGRRWEVRNRRHPPGPLTMRRMRRAGRW